MSRQIPIDRSPGVYYFCFQFYAHDIHFSKDLFNIKNPAIAISSNGTIILGSGKKTSFSMHSEDLYACLDSKPAFVMFVDADPVNTSIKASTTISLNIFAQNKVFLNYEDPSTNLKRNSITLFDNLKNPIGKLDATICISLLDSLNVEVLKDREKKKGTAIRGARIAHKAFNSEIEEEEQKYDVKVTKPEFPPKKGKILSSREQEIKVEPKNAIEKNPFEMEKIIEINEVQEELVGEETKDRDYRNRSKDNKSQNQKGIRNKAEDMDQIDGNEVLDIKKLFMQHK